MQLKEDLNLTSNQAIAVDSTHLHLLSFDVLFLFFFDSKVGFEDLDALFVNVVVGMLLQLFNLGETVGSTCPD